MAHQELTAGGVLNRTIDLLKANVSHTGGYVVGLAVLGTILDVLGVGSNFIYSIASSAAAYFLSRSMLATAGFSLTPANRFGAYIGMGILAGLGILVGFLLLVIPGIILFVRWLPAYGILIAEDAKVTDALGASWERTRDSFWPLLVVSLIYVGLLAVALGGMVLLASIPGISTVASSIPFNLLLAVVGAFSVGLGIAAYLMLGPQANGELGEVFA